MKQPYLSIFWKFIIAIVFTISLFAILNITLVWDKVFLTMDSELSKRISNIAHNLANQSVHYILYKDLSSLQTLTENSKKSDPIILYCIVTDNNFKVLAHTFDHGFPTNLLHANRIQSNDSISIITIEASNFSTKNIKDVMVPVLDGKIGYVRIGINNDYLWSELNKTLITFIIIFCAFSILGFIGAFIFSYLISNPIKGIKTTTETIDINNLGNHTLNLKPKYGKISDKLQIKFKIRDEIDDLMEQFNEMISRLMLTYRELNETQNAMNQTEKLASIGTLVAGIAHEINNPLSGLQSCIRRISAAPDNIEQNIKYLNEMHDASLKIQKVVNGLLDFTRYSSGNKEIQDVSKLIENTIVLLQYKKSFNSIDITTNYLKDKYFLNCNKNEIEQVFFNVLKNSLDAIEERFQLDDKYIGKIDISIIKSDSHINIVFLDNGIGIIKDNLTKVFDPFFTTKDVGKGTGLGCSICYNIVKKNNGNMTIESEYLNWTSVKLSFEIN